MFEIWNQANPNDWIASGDDGGSFPNYPVDRLVDAAVALEPDWFDFVSNNGADN